MKTMSALGTEGQALSQSQINGLLDSYLKTIDASIKRVLLIPPDLTRKHSGAGKLTAYLYEKLAARGVEVDILPALGTHVPMTEQELVDMFGNDIPLDAFIVHNWRDDTVVVGEIPESFVSEVSSQQVSFPIEVKLNKRLVSGDYQLILSVGQVLPHEVVGMANYSKNIFVGCGGVDMINKSHFVGAAYGLERLLGKDHSAVRRLYDYAQENFIKDLPLVYILSANGIEVQKESGLTKILGLFIGDKRDAFEAAVALSQKHNITVLDKPLKKVVVYLDPREYRTTWIGCKAVYRTRMAIADGGELIIIAPGLQRFGEDKAIDKLIRRYGYSGTDVILQKVQTEQDLAENLSAAAHLIHGSSEGRFQVYIASNLERAEIEGVNMGYLSLEDALTSYDPVELTNGYNHIAGEGVFYIDNPATGLWVAREKWLA